MLTEFEFNCLVDDILAEYEYIIFMDPATWLDDFVDTLWALDRLLLMEIVND